MWLSKVLPLVLLFDEHFKHIEIDDGSETIRTISLSFHSHRHTSFVFYMQAALAGVEIGYFNSGYLCQQLDQTALFDCIEEFLNMYLIIHGDNINTDSYALLAVAEHHQWKQTNQTKAIQLFVQLYRNGDPQVRDFH